MHDYPPPPNAAEFRERVKKKLEEAKAAGGTRETVNVAWNEQQINVEVIDLPLGDLYLNPGTHRIRAQRGNEPAKDAALRDTPWDVRSQEYLTHLLRAKPKNTGERDPEFDRLKQSLEDFGQSDPGLVTYDGVLVDGNTRAAAMREIGMQSMRVGVLPESFTWADVNAVELARQLRDDVRRDYTYINRLLAMEEQAALGRTPEQIAKAFRTTTARYYQERWILTTIREQIDRSSSKGGAQLRLSDWEDAQERLRELHRLYEKLASVDRDQAETIKELRLAAIVLEFSKTDVRHIDSVFVKKDYLVKKLPDALRAGAPAAVGTVSIPGLEVELPSSSSAVSAARELGDRVLRARAVIQAKGPETTDADRADQQDVLDEVRDAFDKAIDDAGRDARLRKRKQAAPARLAEACANIDQCVQDFVQARASASLDEEAFDEAVLALKKSMTRLAQQAGRGTTHPGDGVTWLMQAVAGESAR
ncbi:hypothetical protein [Streptomyces sp. NPDC050560]|uniref:hypothetical protein n=1 Tax=Streptomyces sp. NPDC050560 TaxID=3365630 RepID=UPI00378D374A